MKTLIIETSTPLGGVAVAERGVVVASHVFHERHRQGRDLVPAIQRLLSDAGFRPQDLDLIVADEGPGWFTALRVGVAAAKTLAWAAGVALVGVSSLDALAESVPAEHGAVAPLMDAFSGRVYFAVYRLRENPQAGNSSDARALIRKREGPERVLPVDACARSLAECGRPRAFGSGRRRHRAALAHLPELPADAEPAQPAFEALLRLGLAELGEGRRREAHEFRPRYLAHASVTIAGKRRDAPDTPRTLDAGSPSAQPTDTLEP